MRHKRIIIAGGGTGGHIFPAVAVANAIRQQDPTAEILFVGAKGKMEMEKVPQAGYAIEGLDIAGFNRAHMLKNLTLPLKLVKSFWQVRRIFSSFKPDAAFGVGGYSSFPVLRFAQQKGIPTFLHEANAFAGKSNMMLGKKATAIFVATPGMEQFFPAEKITITGNPVRKDIAENKANRQEGLSFFGLDASKPTLLIVGGSLGARSINLAIMNSLQKLTDAGLQLIWQTGKLFIDEAKKAAGNLNGVWVNDFISRMELAYAAADMVISRSGAMSVTELCMVGKPVIFVPYPHAAEDHQTANAMALVSRQAAWLVKDADAATTLAAKAIELAGNEQVRQSLAANIVKDVQRDADHYIASKILASIGA